MQKKLMLLGGIRYLLPVIKAAHEQGYYVITADYLPDNIAHKYRDKYVLEKNNLEKNQIDYYIFHQANIVYIEVTLSHKKS